MILYNEQKQIYNTLTHIYTKCYKYKSYAKFKFNFDIINIVRGSPFKFRGFVNNAQHMHV